MNEDEIEEVFLRRMPNGGWTVMFRTLEKRESFGFEAVPFGAYSSNGEMLDDVRKLVGGGNYE